MVKNFRIRELGNGEKKAKRNQLSINVQENRFKRVLFLPTYIYLVVRCIFRPHPDTDSENIRTA